jgi:hypothetical protein
MFREMFSPIIRSTWLYLQYPVVFIQDAAAAVELTWNNKLIYIVHDVGYLHNSLNNIRINLQTFCYLPPVSAEDKTVSRYTTRPPVHLYMF